MAEETDPEVRISGMAVQSGELEYRLANRRLAVVWPDHCLHIFESEEDYRNPEIEPIEVVSPSPEAGVPSPEPEKLTSELKKKYLSKGGRCCPYCDSSAIESEPHDTDNDYHLRKVTCECKKSWIDFYVLTDVMED